MKRQFFEWPVDNCCRSQTEAYATIKVRRPEGTPDEELNGAAFNDLREWVFERGGHFIWIACERYKFQPSTDYILKVNLRTDSDAVLCRLRWPNLVGCTNDTKMGQ